MPMMGNAALAGGLGEVAAASREDFFRRSFDFDFGFMVIWATPGSRVGGVNHGGSRWPDCQNLAVKCRVCARTAARIGPTLPRAVAHWRFDS